jgi:hypothetical protein
LVAGEIKGMSEIASAYFPRKVAGLQAAWRLREEGWQASITVERLAQSIRADVTHLFTVNEGVVYGSSVLNYLVSGAPVSMLRVASLAEYSNVEFTGRDIRSWKRTESGYDVYLQSPVYGNYTLLATYDRQFGARSNQVNLVGMSAVDAQAEQGTVLLVSELPLQAKPVQVSAGMMQLEPGEISPEQRLLFDAPILGAYQYSARPFTLQLGLEALEPGETARQVVDRAALETQVSRQGEIVTAAKYFVKNQGYSHLRLTLPPDSKLWDAKVGGARVVPVSDNADTLIPLPRQADPQVALCVELNVASTSSSPAKVALKSPALSVPVILTEWTIKPDENYHLECRESSVKVPTGRENTGFDWFAMAWDGVRRVRSLVILTPVFLGLGILLLRLSTGAGRRLWDGGHIAGSVLGTVCMLMAVACMGCVAVLSLRHPVELPGAIELSAPMQQAGQTLQVVVGNVVNGMQLVSWSSWPALLGIVLWGMLVAKRLQGSAGRLGWLAGWALICWGVLRSSGGVPVFMGVLVACLAAHVFLPLLKGQLKLPRQVKLQPTGATTAALLLCFGLFGGVAAQAGPKPVAVAQSLTQEIRIQDGHAFVNARVVWEAEAGQTFDFLAAPAVLIRCQPDKAAVKLGERRTDGGAVYTLTAGEGGRFEAVFEYQMSVKKWSSESTVLEMPTPASLVNRASLKFPGLDVDVFSTNAVSIATTHSREGDRDMTQSELVLVSSEQPLVKWSPRSRDPESEKSVFYGELRHVLIPTSGLVEGLHDAQIRPAQGQLSELNFSVPEAMTITDVQSPLVASWRLEAPLDEGAKAGARGRLLRVRLTSPQSRPFALKLFSQQGSRPLPYEMTNRVISLEQAAGQVGLVGVMTGAEVQLDGVHENGMSAINLEDFPGGIVEEGRIPGLAIRRAFRYSDASASIVMTASAVQPDVRVETQETLSLGEDRTVLASKLTAHILRAGIFKLSFALPQDFEVESLSGGALSHWTESKAGSNRVVTLNLKGKTDGDQVFNVSLAGPGLARRLQWEAPRVVFREAAKQTGQMVLAPEPGVRLHVSQPDGVSQLDPKKIGLQQKGVLAFRILRADWRLPFEIETVEPWIQASSLQDVTVRESQMLVSAQVDYLIENAGVKDLLVDVPENAENVRFDGELISDSVRLPEVTSGRVCWDVKLQRRVMGDYSLRLTYQVGTTNTNAAIVGIKSHNANLRHGWLAVRSDGRLQVRFPSIPGSLQAADWQAIPSSLRRLKEMAQPKDAFAVLEADYELGFERTRHAAAKVLPARVNELKLTSVIAESGETLTEGALMIDPGDKRFLTLRLPAGAKFWHGSINGHSVWPWRDGDSLVLLLEKSSIPDAPTVVEFTYSCTVGNQGGRQLQGPKFDLPLENISWTLGAPENWTVRETRGSLQRVVGGGSSDTMEPAPLVEYLSEENARLEEQTQRAGEYLKMGNSFLAKGTPNQARQAYQSAWRLSTQDAAMNEDARVQLHNLKMQQALLGLNQRRQGVFESVDKAAPGSGRRMFSQWSPGQSPDYTQDQVREALEGNGNDDNAALMKVAERLIRQQDETAGRPEAIRTTVPHMGRQLFFKGSLQVSEWADLNIQFQPADKGSHRTLKQLGWVLGLFGVLAVLGWLSAGKRRSPVAGE